jgi:methionine biosynthesis protein MetW
MFYFVGSRKPSFKDISRIDYDQYWLARGFELRSKLMAREKICFGWIKPNSSVLDVGCGNSRLLFELKNKKNCKVFALDCSALVIDSLNQKNDIPGQVIDITKSDFEFVKEKEYDYIILNEVLEHLANPEEVINKLKTKSRCLIISIPNTGYYRYRLNLMFNGRFPTQWYKHPSEHLRFWTHKDFLIWLDDLGFDLMDCRTSDGFHFFKNHWKNIFGHLISYLVKIKE